MKQIYKMGVNKCVQECILSIYSGRSIDANVMC